MWTGCIQKPGYGRFRTPGRTVYSHRFSYELFVGPIPAGTELDHKCRNTRCLNPEHLEPVSHVENIMRGQSPMARHAKKTHCPRGHEYTPENTRMNLGQRHCRACQKAWNDARYEHRTEGIVTIANYTVPTPERKRRRA